jgi:DNA-binding Lrp family transcriptional regulator
MFLAGFIITENLNMSIRPYHRKYWIYPVGGFHLPPLKFLLRRWIMPVSAYILMEAEPGKVKDLILEVAQIEGVTKACGVTGPFDIIASLDVPDIDSLGDVVTKRVQTLAGIRKTITCLCTFCAKP